MRACVSVRVCRFARVFLAYVRASYIAFHIWQVTVRCVANLLSLQCPRVGQLKTIDPATNKPVFFEQEWQEDQFDARQKGACACRRVSLYGFLTFFFPSFLSSVFLTLGPMDKPIAPDSRWYHSTESVFTSMHPEDEHDLQCSCRLLRQKRKKVRVTSPLRCHLFVSLLVVSFLLLTLMLTDAPLRRPRVPGWFGLVPLAQRQRGPQPHPAPSHPARAARTRRDERTPHAHVILPRSNERLQQ